MSPASLSRLFSAAVAVLAIGLAWAAPAGAREFVHPGILNSRAELDFVKARIKAGEQPWAGEFDRLASSDYAKRAPHPLATIHSQSRDAATSRDDAIAAYTQALLWYHSGDVMYAHRAVAILNAWSDLQGFTSGSEQDRLQAGWIGAVFAPAAEIMRLSAAWKPADVARFQAMLKRAFYPQLNTASFWNGNVDLTQIDAMLGIAVFCDDAAEFELGLARLKERLPAYFYLTSDGPTPRPIKGDGGNLPKFWHQPRHWVDGLSQETCRDNGHHTQFALGSALHAAEIAWQQGVDVYADYQDRLVAALELHAQHLLTNSMQGVAANDVPTKSRFDTWEIGYNHYHRRLGLPLPYTGRLITEQIRPRANRADWNLVYETLTHAALGKR